MPRQPPPSLREKTPGQMYREIRVSLPEFEEGEGDTALAKEKPHPFVQFCRRINGMFPGLGKGAKFQPEYQQAIDFLGWKLTAEEFSGTIKLALYLGVGLGVLIGTLLYFSPVAAAIDAFLLVPYLTPIILFVPFLLIGMAIAAFVQNYPLNAAKEEQIRALTYVPDIVGYMIMSMKLVPNLEKAVEFAAEHGRGKIADDFRRTLWEVQIGVHNSLSEALDALAYRWGKFSDEFKHALMMIRASVLENTEAKRYALLDKTMQDILDAIKVKMENYARALSQPTVMLFYIGVLLPLILIIVLPVGSTFSGAPLANPFALFFIYNLFIPALTIVFASGLIKQRPPTYLSPVIPDSFPGLPPQGVIRTKGGQFSLPLAMGVVLVLGLVFAYFLSTQGLPPLLLVKDRSLQFLKADLSPELALQKDGKPADYFAEGGPRYRELLSMGIKEGKVPTQLAVEQQTFFSRSEFDITPYNLMFVVLITFSLLVYMYFHFTTIYKREAQQKIEQMETEFKDSLYVIASRMGENKPVEEAMKHTREFLPQYAISEALFGKTIDNISLLGMPLDAAVFDPGYGALKNNPSSLIRGGMQLLIDSVQLGVNVAARTLISLSIQLDNSEKVNRTLTQLVQDTTGIMRNMSTFIAPIVLGITTTLQKIVIITLFSISSSSILQQAQDTSLPGVSGGALGAGFSGANLNALINAEAIGQIASPTQFVFVVSLYIIELVFIMTYFTTRIEQDNDLLVRLNIAKAMPIAVTVFVLSMIASNALTGGFIGG